MVLVHFNGMFNVLSLSCTEIFHGLYTVCSSGVFCVAVFCFKL